MGETAGGEYRQGNGPFFSMVPWDLQDDPETDAYDIAVYAAVRRFADFGKDTGSFVSDKHGAKVAGCATRTFRYRREHLRELGWIEWETREGLCNLYAVHNSPVEQTPA